MEFTINQSKQSKIINSAGNNRKSVKTIRKVRRVVGVVGIGLAALYLLLNMLVPSFNMENINGVMQKNTFKTFLTLSFILVPTVFFFSLLGFMAKHLSKVDIVTRANETLFIKNNTLEYVFRDMYNSLSKERYRVTINLVKDCAVYDKDMSAVKFKKNINIEFYSDYRKGIVKSESEMEEFVIYDYFAPSLKKELDKIGAIAE